MTVFQVNVVVVSPVLILEGIHLVPASILFQLSGRVCSQDDGCIVLLNYLQGLRESEAGRIAKS